MWKSVMIKRLPLHIIYLFTTHYRLSSRSAYRSAAALSWCGLFYQSLLLKVYYIDTQHIKTQLAICWTWGEVIWHSEHFQFHLSGWIWWILSHSKYIYVCTVHCTSYNPFSCIWSIWIPSSHITLTNYYCFRNTNDKLISMSGNIVFFSIHLNLDPWTLVPGIVERSRRKCMMSVYFLRENKKRISHSWYEKDLRTWIPIPNLDSSFIFHISDTCGHDTWEVKKKYKKKRER